MFYLSEDHVGVKEHYMFVVGGWVLPFVSM